MGMSVNAQLQHGSILVGADLSKMSFGFEGENFSLQINPKSAYFIFDNTAVGGYQTFALKTAKGEGESISFGVGIFARYYLNKNDASKMVHHSSFFLEGNAGIEGDNPAVGDNTNGLGIGAGPGWTFFITPNFALEALFKYNGIIGFGTSPTSNNLSLALGFQVYLPFVRIR